MSEILIYVLFGNICGKLIKINFNEINLCIHSFHPDIAEDNHTWNFQGTFTGCIKRHLQLKWAWKINLHWQTMNAFGKWWPGRLQIRLITRRFSICMFMGLVDGNYLLKIPNVHFIPKSFDNFVNRKPNCPSVIDVRRSVDKIWNHVRLNVTVAGPQQLPAECMHAIAGDPHLTCTRDVLRADHSPDHRPRFAVTMLNAEVSRFAVASAAVMQRDRFHAFGSRSNRY